MLGKTQLRRRDKLTMPSGAALLSNGFFKENTLGLIYRKETIPAFVANRYLPKRSNTIYRIHFISKCK